MIIALVVGTIMTVCMKCNLKRQQASKKTNYELTSNTNNCNSKIVNKDKMELMNDFDDN